ncbi:MAG TPA: helix-turn-helix domain-containing protein [Bryobacteraceae bacterium]|nr:helix-turn-helix domain-containing protein [Bryobacteraceae bacterium]
MPRNSNLAKSAPVFAALGDRTRLRLLLRLSSGGPRSIKDLSKQSTITRQAITKHLEILARAGLVRGARRGREHVWRFQPNRMDEARRSLDQISRQWDQALARLKTFVEA